MLHTKQYSLKIIKSKDKKVFFYFFALVKKYSIHKTFKNNIGTIKPGVNYVKNYYQYRNILRHG